MIDWWRGALLAGAAGIVVAAFERDWKTSAAPTDASSPETIAAQPETGAGGEWLEFAVIDGRRIALVQLRAEIDGVPLATMWSDIFRALFEFFDRDQSGALSRNEFALAPSAFTIRQIMWGHILPSGEPPLNLADADCDGDQQVELAEFTHYYRRRRVNGITVAMGKSLVSSALTAALWTQLDRNHDGNLAAEELRRAPKLIAACDANGDEMISPQELVPGVSYPPAAGTMLLSPPGALKPSLELGDVPIIILPLAQDDTHWTSSVLNLLDDDGNGRLSRDEAALPTDVWRRVRGEDHHELNAAELVAWRQSTPAAVWRASFSTSGADRLTQNGRERASAADEISPWATVQVGETTMRLRPVDGSLDNAYEAAQKQYVAMFDESDVNRDGAASMDEISAKASLGLLRRVAEVANRNADARLSREELEAWLALQQQIVDGLLLLSILEYERGFFESLDADANGALSVRELRSAESLLLLHNAADSEFTPEHLPRNFICTLSRGLPSSSAMPPLNHDPVWFDPMDRNRDGDISRSEFIGPPETFSAVDGDGDGLISSAEAFLYDSRVK